MEKTGTIEKAEMKPWIYLGLYVLVLFVSATTRDFGLSPLVSHTLGSIAVAFVEPLWKLLFWIIPMLVILSATGERDILGYLKLKRHVKKGILWGILGSIILLLLGINLLLHGRLTLNHSLDDWVNLVLLVGLIEETVFRGFLYQFIQRRLAPKLDAPFILTSDQEEEEPDRFTKWLERLLTGSEMWAALLSTLIFAAIHFPLWLRVLHPSLQVMVATTLFNLFLGLVQCALLKYSGSLWSCIVVHTLHDLTLLLF